MWITQKIYFCIINGQLSAINIDTTISPPFPTSYQPYNTPDLIQLDIRNRNFSFQSARKNVDVQWLLSDVTIDLFILMFNGFFLIAHLLFVLLRFG